MRGAGKNQSLFREVNERVSDVNEAHLGANQGLGADQASRDFRPNGARSGSSPVRSVAVARNTTMCLLMGTLRYSGRSSGDPF
jgi:hypothetical protein